MSKRIRKKKIRMQLIKALERMERGELLAQVTKLTFQVERLKAENEKLREQNDQLRKLHGQSKAW